MHKLSASQTTCVHITLSHLFLLLFFKILIIILSLQSKYVCVYASFVVRSSFSAIFSLFQFWILNNFLSNNSWSLVTVCILYSWVQPMRNRSFRKLLKECNCFDTTVKLLTSQWKGCIRTNGFAFFVLLFSSFICHFNVSFTTRFGYLIRNLSF